MPDYQMPFNPNVVSMSDLMNVSPMLNQAGSLYGAALPSGMNQDMMSQAGQGLLNMPNRQNMTMPDKGMSQNDMMKLASMAMQGFGKGQQGIQAPTQQIMRDTNRFSYTQNPQQQMAQALRNRG